MPLTFNATTDHVTCGDLTQIEGATALTVVWRGQLSSVGGGGVLGLYVSKKDTFYLYDQGLGFLKFSVLGSGTSREYHVTAGGLTTGVNYTFVARWRASDGTLKIAVNGVDQSLTQDVGGSVATLAANTNVLCIGQNSDGGYDSFQGDARDVSVWSTYLDDATVAAIYNGGTGGKGKSGEFYTTGLVGTWRLTDTSTLTDNSGNGWDGTNSGTTNGSLGPDVEYPPAVPPDPPTCSSATVASIPAGTAGNFSSPTVASHTSGDGTNTHVFALSPAGTLTLVFSASVTFDGVVGDITFNAGIHAGETTTIDIAADTFTATNINGSTGNDAITNHAVTNNSAVYWLRTGVRQYGVIEAVIGSDASVDSNEDNGIISGASAGGGGTVRNTALIPQLTRHKRR